MWQRALAAVLVGVVISLASCARPQRRPETAQTTPPESLSAAVAKAASMDSGAGQTAAAVIDRRALVAIQLDAAQPGGTNGGSLLGSTKQTRSSERTDAGTGPTHLYGPGGSTGTNPATPGGGIHPGGFSQGGSPGRTQAIPNGAGGLANEAGSNVPVPAPGGFGSAPLDVMHRIANQIKSRVPEITEVRFAHAPNDARRVQALAQRLERGEAPDRLYAEFNELWDLSIPAGTTQFDPMRPQPAQNPGPATPGTNRP